MTFLLFAAYSAPSEPSFEDGNGWATLLFFIPFIIGGIYIAFVKYRFYYWQHRRPLEPHRKRILEQYYRYYMNLDADLKGVFERRVGLFLTGKQFYGKDGLEITEEMRVLVAATAIQLTFGYRYFQLPKFKKIFIYPTVYYSHENQKNHKGHVSPMAGAIALSWDNFLHGHKDHDDGINLGIHEMAHALSLENRIQNGTANFISPRAQREWKQLASFEMGRIAKGDKSIFRSYAGVNLEEFFAVSVEVFFEQPNEFYAYDRDLFLATCKVLNQFPVII